MKESKHNQSMHQDHQNSFLQIVLPNPINAIKTKMITRKIKIGALIRLMTLLIISRTISHIFNYTNLNRSLRIMPVVFGEP
jgi:hypothetical protein